MDLDAYRDIRGWFGDGDATALRDLAERVVRPRGRVFEIGSYRGRSAWVLAWVCQTVHPPATLTLVDTFMGVPGVTGQEDPEELEADLRQRFQPYEFVRVWKAESSEAAAHTPAGLDLVFIDGSHDEDSVMRDLLAWWPLVRPGGLLCGHDYDSRSDPGVVIAVNRAFADVNAQRRVWWVSKAK